MAERPRLELHDVELVAGGVRVLDRVAVSIELDRRTVIVGPNGAGKTTLLQVMHGLAHPTAGQVTASGAASGRAPRLAYVFQVPVMLRRSARANIEHALSLAGVDAERAGRRADAALADVGLAYAADRPARRLSGGEKQRLAIARAEALDPECLLLDEPTSNLDPAAAASIERHLLALAARGLGVVMTTHNLAQARRFAQRVVFLSRGRVVECADADAFFERPRSDEARRFLAGEWLGQRLSSVDGR